MHTYKIVDELDYVAVTLIQHKYSFIYDGISITLAAPEEFVQNIRNQDKGMASIPFYRIK